MYQKLKKFLSSSHKVIFKAHPGFKKVLQDAKSGDFDDISELLEESVSKDVRKVNEQLESDLKQVYNESQNTTSSKER